MSSYHSNFTYNGENSAKDRNLIIAAFEPDNELKETFLSMDVIEEDYYDGTKKFTYGSRYNTTSTVTITVIKNNGSDFSLNEVRSCLRWLTGSRVDSWLDMYVGENFQYSFLGRITDVQQQKMDARTIGLVITFTSVSPWAYSAPQTFDCPIYQLLDIVEGGILSQSGENVSSLGVHDGVLTPNYYDKDTYFNINDDGVVYLDTKYRSMINNESDDLYTYIYLDIEYLNESSTYLSIKNNTLNEESIISNITANESISISAKQFIISSIRKRFGDDFNFVWPRLKAGDNDFEVEGNGRGTVKFTYRYPMKVGDCAMDISISGGDINCGTCPDDGNENFNGTIAWSNIKDTPSTLEGYGITDAYTIDEVDTKINDIEISGGTGGSVNIDENQFNDMLADIFG